MEEYPEELRTPPVGLVALVGVPELHPTISNFLHSEQPPINSLALPDFSDTAFLGRKLKDGPLRSQPKSPSGVLGRHWLSKHRTRIPSVVAAFFSAHQVSGDPTQWLKVCTDLESLKSVISGRNIKLVVAVVQSTVNDIVAEDQMTALRKRAEIDAKCLAVFIQNGPSELRQSLARLGHLFAELSITYYREEGRQLKTRIEKKSFSFAELHIRYCFKVAVYAEFRSDWAEALKYYEDAYHALRETIGTSIRLPPIQRLVEIKAVAEQLHLKVSTLLLHSGKITEAITWFWNHIACYEKLTGDPEVFFLHWEWMSKQYLVFAELLETSSAAIPGTVPLPTVTSERPITEWKLRPAYYYQLAACCLREKRSALEISLSAVEKPEYSAELNAIKNRTDAVAPALFIGQYAWMIENGETYTMQSLTDLEYLVYAASEANQYQDSYEIVALFTKSYDLYNSLKAHRMASYCSNQMAREHFALGDFNRAKNLFDGIATLYRQEGWLTLLWEILGYLRECSTKIGFLKEYVEYSLEMASLPITSGTHTETIDLKCDYGPAGFPSLLQRETIYEEISGILKGEPLSTRNNNLGSISLTENEPLYLEIDLVNPLRSVFLASVAFHDQSVKPGLPTSLTLSLVSHLPHPLEIEQLEIQFNQPACNFTVRNVDKQSLETQENADPVKDAQCLTLTPDKWSRLTFDIIPGQSGKLECLSVLARIGRYLTICFRAESPASMEDLPLWKFEDRIETVPTKDPILAFTGQKVIQVEEPEPLVDLVVSSSGSPLVGEIFPVSVLVTAKGHMVCAGELKINLVDTRGELLTPKDIDSSSSEDDVELLGISMSTEHEAQQNTETIRKVQQSFGLFSVPFLNMGESWCCRLDIKWQRPKSMMLYVSLGYSPNNSETTSQKVHVHKSLQLEGKVAIMLSHQFMMPYRKDLLLLSKMREDSPSSNRMTTLALLEKNILFVTAKNCSVVPLQLISTSFERHNNDKEACVIRHASVPGHGLESNCSDSVSCELVLMPGEEFKCISSVIPLKECLNLAMGTVSVRWKRKSKLIDSDSCMETEIVTKQKLQDVKVEKAVLVVYLDCPPYAILGVPFTFCVKIQNQTPLMQEIQYFLVESQSFLLSGAHSDTVFVQPNSEHTLAYTLLPLFSGPQQLPQLVVTSQRYLARLQTSASASSLFVFPLKPQMQLNPINKEGTEAGVETGTR